MIIRCRSGGRRNGPFRIPASRLAKKPPMCTWRTTRTCSTPPPPTSSSSRMRNSSTTTALQDPSAVNPSPRWVSQPEPFRKTQDEIPGFTGGWSSGITEIGEFSFDGGIYGKNSFRQDSEGSCHHRQLHQDRQDPLHQGRLLLGYLRRTSSPIEWPESSIGACSTLRTGAPPPPTT
jgi:hypothetical protein